MESEEMADRIEGLLEGRNFYILAGAVLVIGIIIGLLTLGLQPHSAEDDYTISYGELTATKNVSITPDSHTETIIFETTEPTLEYVIFTTVPEALAKSMKAIDYQTNGRITILENSFIVKTEAKNLPNSIALQLGFPSGGEDVCAVSIILPKSYVDAMSEEHMAELKSVLSEFRELDVYCELANDAENEITQQAYAVFG